MDRYVTGETIRKAREKRHMTQQELADMLCVSDKTVSKWETGRGYPDITLLESIGKALDMSVIELMSGNDIENTNTAGNMRKTKFHVCPICGNIIMSAGEAVVNCHGLTLHPCESEDADEAHMPVIEPVEDEYYVSIDHPMTKDHYISFIAGVYDDGIRIVKLYSEGDAHARLKVSRLRYILCYCNRHGLKKISVTSFR